MVVLLIVVVNSFIFGLFLGVRGVQGYLIVVYLQGFDFQVIKLLNIEQ